MLKKIDWGGLTQDGVIFGRFIKYSDGSLIPKRKIISSMRRGNCTVYKYERYLSDI